jgi:hypothetical protein
MIYTPELNPEQLTSLQEQIIARKQLEVNFRLWATRLLRHLIGVAGKKPARKNT